jgi:hypothetical protein
MNIATALQNLRPGANYEVNGETYEGIVWRDGNKTAIPTKEEVLAEVARLQNAWANLAYQRKRIPEYPPIGDQLDALWKGGDAAAAMLEKIQAVKNKYPKPEGV